MTTRTAALPLGWVVPGPLRQLTGGYLYDARIVDGLRERGWRVGIVDLRSSRWPLDVLAGRRLVTAIGQRRWRAVVVDELAHPALTAALLSGRLRGALAGAPLILMVHHLRCSEPGDRILRGVAMLVERLALRSADLVLCTSETTARTVRPLARRGVRVEVVRPGWDTQVRQDPLPNPSPSKGEGPGEGVLRLLLVGHWTPRKGILDALAAVARLGPGVTLDLVGEQDRDPVYAARVRAALGSPALTGRVTASGRVSADALVERYAAADALLMPSTHEGYGMVLAEALAAGLPIVATRVGAIPEVVRDGREAELVPAGDIAALARAIERLAADPAERERRARLARARARSLPRWSDSVNDFAGHLDGLLARTASGV